MSPRFARIFLGSRPIPWGVQPLLWRFGASMFIPVPSSGTCANSLAPSVMAIPLLKKLIPLLSTTDPEDVSLLTRVLKFQSGREWAVKHILKSNCHTGRVRMLIYW